MQRDQWKRDARRAQTLDAASLVFDAIKVGCLYIHQGRQGCSGAKIRHPDGYQLWLDSWLSIPKVPRTLAPCSDTWLSGVPTDLGDA